MAGGGEATRAARRNESFKKAAPDDDVPTESLRDVVAFLLRKDWRERPTAHDAVRIEARLSEWAEA